MADKERFLLFYQQNPNIPLYYTPEWLDVVTENKWDIACTWHEDGRMLAFMPITKKEKWGLNFFTNPILTPHQGIYFPDLFEIAKEQKKQSLIFKGCRDIMTKLGNPTFFKVRFHPTFSNWLPFYYQGFEQTTYYSYVLEDIGNHDQIFEGFKFNTRNIIRKAEASLRVLEGEDPSILYKLLVKTFAQKKTKIPFSEEFLVKLDATMKTKRKLLFVEDQQGNIHAGMFLVFDKNTAYNILFGTDFSMVKSGGPSLLIWEAIKRASERVQRFDFEGSRLPTVQPFYQGFGGVPTPFYEIYKARNRFWNLVFFLTGKK